MAISRRFAGERRRCEDQEPMPPSAASPRRSCAVPLLKTSVAAPGEGAGAQARPSWMGLVRRDGLQRREEASRKIAADSRFGIPGCLRGNSGYGRVEPALEAGLHRQRRGGRPRVHFQGAQQRGNVHAHGERRDRQRAADFLVRQAIGDQPQYRLLRGVRASRRARCRLPALDLPRRHHGCRCRASATPCRSPRPRDLPR